MRRYVIGMVITAVLVGSLFRAADETGVRLMRMFGTLGILLFGVIGTMALTRLQSRHGLKETEAALKALEPEHLITDWTYQGKGRPDYLIVGPEGIAAVCLEEMARSLWTRQTARKIERGRERAHKAAQWTREALLNGSKSLRPSLSILAPRIPVRPILVLTRTPAGSEYADDEVAVVNPNALLDVIRSFQADGLVAGSQTGEPAEILTKSDRTSLTRMFREG